MVTTARSEPTVQFMLELAAALNDVGEPVALNQARMERIATAYGVTEAAGDPEDGLRRLEQIATFRHRFGTLGVIGGHMG